MPILRRQKVQAEHLIAETRHQAARGRPPRLPVRLVPQAIHQEGLLDQPQATLSQSQATFSLPDLRTVVFDRQQSQRPHAVVSRPQPQVFVLCLRQAVPAQGQVQLPPCRPHWRTTQPLLPLQTRFRHQIQAQRAHPLRSRRRKTFCMLAVLQNLLRKSRPAEAFEKVPRNDPRPTHQAQRASDAANYRLRQLSPCLTVLLVNYTHLKYWVKIRYGPNINIVLKSVFCYVIIIVTPSRKSGQNERKSSTKNDSVICMRVHLSVLLYST